MNFTRQTIGVFDVEIFLSIGNLKKY